MVDCLPVHVIAKGAIMTAIKKIFQWKPSARFLSVLFVVLLVIAIFPIARLTIYAVPYYDDYNFGQFGRNGILSYGGILGAIRGAIEGAYVEHYAWQGTYSSIFFMSLMPVIWGEEYYFLGPLFIILMLLAGTLVLTHVLLKSVLGISAQYRLPVQVIITISLFMFIYTAQQGFYWYNGGVHYVGMHGFGMLFIASAISLPRTEMRGKKILWGVVLTLLTSALAFLTAGANFVTALQGLLVLLSIFALEFLMEKRKAALLLLPAMALYGYGFFLNVTAPGNEHREASYVGWGYGPVESVARSFLEGIKHIPEYTGLITVVVMILLIPPIWAMLENISYRFRWPGLFFLWSLCLYATGYTPSLYAMGTAGLSRTLNAVKLTFLLLLFLNEIYFLGWLKEKPTALSKKESRVARIGSGMIAWNGQASWLFYPIVGGVLLLIFLASPNQAGHYASYGAYYYVHTGEAYNFHQEYLDRIELLQSDEADVVLKPYYWRPWFLIWNDLSEDASAEENQAITFWYGKNSVRLESNADEKG